MTTAQPTTQQPSPDTAPVPPSQSSSSQRVLACVLCQQRKVKCDRNFPCANCVKHQVQCVPTTKARRRRRRFPERELLDRLRKYEDLLRQNNISFGPLHEDAGVSDHEYPAGSYGPDDDQPEVGSADCPSRPSSSKTESTYPPRNIWNAMNQQFRSLSHDSGSQLDGVREAVVKGAMDQMFDNEDHILFGSRKVAIDLFAFHPDPAHIFRLWQIYLDNVDPLLKVTHTPSLQGRIAEAASDVRHIPPALEALMFSIYSTSIQSLAVDDCQAMFSSTKEELVTKYRFGCEQALLNCGFLRTADRDCLTALFLYLTSTHFHAHPRSLSSMLGIAVRIAQRMGMHDESFLTRYPVLEAEMRRRLWWSLVLLDHRIGELAGFTASTLAPTWNCRIPLNVNDFDLRAEMKDAPVVRGAATEAIFAVARSELGDYVRHASFHLDFNNYTLKPILKGIAERGDLDALEKRMEEEYLQFCDLENPLQFMTAWMTRAYISRCRLVEHYLRYTTSPEAHNEVQRDAAMSYAFRMLECDTKMMTSPLTKGFRWHLNFYFPLPAYIDIVQDLIRRPVSKQSGKAWVVMNENYDARVIVPGLEASPLWRMFASVVLQAWEALKAVAKAPEQEVKPPDIVVRIKQKEAEIAQNAQTVDTEQANSEINMADNDFSTLMPTDFGIPNLGFGMTEQEGCTGMDPTLSTNMDSQPASNMDMSMHQFYRASMIWSLAQRRAW